MTRSEALIFLPIDDENDAEDLFDQKLFEQKQFFLNRFPISKLIQSRLNKLEKIEEAYLVLDGELRKSDSIVDIEFPTHKDVRDAFAWYNEQKNGARLRLNGAKSVSDLSTCLYQLLSLTRHYARAWWIESDDSEQDLKVSTEPNPMDIQEALDQINQDQIVDSNYILSLPEDNCLKSEAKRLSLWLNFENDEQSV